MSDANQPRLSAATGFKALLLVAALLVLPAVVPGQYAMQLVNLGLISLIVVVGLNFITGYCGQINFAQAAFWGIGAYVTALLTLKGLSFWLALPLAALATGLCSLLLGVPTLRLRAFYLAMATIAFGEIVQLVLVHWETVTGGTSGLRNVPGISLFGHVLSGHREHYYFLLVWAALGLGLSLRIRASKIGRAMIALRDSEIAAEVMGVDTVRTKMLAFMLASVYAGVAGSLYVSSLHYVSPDLFSNAQAVLFFVMLVIGGAGSAVGALLGTAVLTVLPEALRFLKEWYLVLYGVGVILMVCFLPEGLISLRQRVLARGRAAVADEAEGRTAGAAADADLSASASANALAAAQPDRQPDSAWLKASAGAAIPEAADRANPSNAPHAADAGKPAVDGGLVIASVTQRFGGLVALDAVSLRVAPGQVHAVIGPNGSGKTTFLNVLSGAYRAQSGSVLLAGTELIGSRPSAIARAGLSRTFQNIRVYKSLSALENVMVGAACHQATGLRGLLGVLGGTARQRREEQALADRALQALHFVGLGAYAERPAGSLAYAQQRLLEIARALATQPRVLLLDEPAAGMNPQESTRLMAVIAAIRDAGITVVFVEHNVRLVMGVSDTVTVFDFGRKIAEGTPQQVQADEAVIAAYLGHPRQTPQTPETPQTDRSGPTLSAPETGHA